MKKIYTLITAIIILSASYSTLKAQSFTVKDTVNCLWVGTSSINYLDTFINTSSTDSITINWKVIATDFPADWQAATGICDNVTCYSYPALWPSEAIKGSGKYGPGLGDFHVQTNLYGVSNGTHYVTVRMHNSAVASDSATSTWVFNKASTSVSNIIRSTDEVVLYPNPAHDELNIIYDANSDVKNVAVYNIIGKVMTVYKVTDNSSANLNLENIPSGIYFVRLMNSHGGMVATKKFTKQ